MAERVLSSTFSSARVDRGVRPYQTTEVPCRAGEASLAPPRAVAAVSDRRSPVVPQSGTALPHGGPAEAGPPLHQPWRLPAQGLAVFHGGGDVARLSHYFLPRLLLAGKRVLMLDGANAADPRLLERFARERGVPFRQFSRQIQIARAFTCFQLTELVARVPRFLCDFPAQVLIVTAFPDLYFDEDVRDWNARVAFEQALRDLRRWAGCVAPGFSPAPVAAVGACPDAGRDRRPDPALRERRYRLRPLLGADLKPGATVAVFSAASTFEPSPARRRFFSKLCTAANEVWKFSVDAESRLKLIAEPPRPRLGGL